MVAPNVPRVDFIPQVNLSRAFLFRAHDALEAGRIFEAGVLLREAVRRQLYAECASKGCLPETTAEHRSPMALLGALKRAGHVGYVGWQWTKDIIQLGNKCAHCVSVDPGTIRFGIEVWHGSIDHDPCGEPKERYAHHKLDTKADAYDDGYSEFDDGTDSADWWKREGGAQ
jgi:hypothetical protein